ncbi:MAG: hypothetical protein GY880_20810 [Planctomycetaceae bacterium]|nr:hypothetical protein [Planctomycetaceae bacterium]
MSNGTETEKRLSNAFCAGVAGRRITHAYYDAASAMPVILLDDGTGIYIQSDDEGNGAGVPVHVSGDSGNQKETGMWGIQR